MCSREPAVPPWLWGVQILADHANMQLRKQKMPWELENFEGMGLLQLVIDFNKPLLEILIYLLQNLCFRCLRRALIRNWSIPGLWKSCSCKINLHWFFFFFFFISPLVLGLLYQPPFRSWLLFTQNFFNKLVLFKWWGGGHRQNQALPL